MESRQEKLDFVINKLNKLKGLEFIDGNEIASVNYANMILRRTKAKLDKSEVLKEKGVIKCLLIQVLVARSILL